MKKNISTADKLVRYQTPLVEVFTLDHEGAVCTGSQKGVFNALSDDEEASGDYWN